MCPDRLNHNLVIYGHNRRRNKWPLPRLLVQHLDLHYYYMYSINNHSLHSLDNIHGWVNTSNTGRLVPMSTRTHVNSYPCQLVPLTDVVNSYHKWCELVPQVMSTRTQQGKYQMMVRVDIYYHTIDLSTRTHVNSYQCQLVPMSTRTTKRCQLVPSSDVNLYPTRQVSDDGTSWHLL